jgi:hypothetical protein
MRKFILSAAVGVALLLSSASVSSAGETQIIAKWRNCDTTKAGLSFRTTFYSPARNYGSGRYLIKSEIRWDKYRYGMWRASDVSTRQTPWLKIRNPEYHFSLSHGDRTTWGASLFAERWRAHVTVKLIKNRPGPKDKRVETVERFFEKPMFTEVGACEGVSLGS